MVISTIQRVYRVLAGETAPEGDDPGLDDCVTDAPVAVVYNPHLPPETFDLVIVDEAHRSRVAMVVGGGRGDEEPPCRPGMGGWVRHRW